MMVGVGPDNLQTADSIELETGADTGETFHFSRWVTLLHFWP